MQVSYSTKQSSNI